MSMTDEEQNHDVDLEQLHDALLRLRNGDFSARLPTTWEHRTGMVARVFNSLAEMLETLSREFIRVSDQTGKQSYLGAQAEVNDVSGRWGEMVASLNDMAFVLTLELRRTSATARAWAEGDMTQRLTPGRISGELAEMQQRLDAAALRWADAPGNRP
jgi:methyl-accepting chemotaxis protein